MLKVKLQNALWKMSGFFDATFVRIATAAGVLGILCVPNMAYAEGTMDNILKNVGNVVVAVIAIVTIAFTVKAMLGHMKGDGSIGKVVATFLTGLFFFGLVLVLTNASTLAQLFQPIAQSSVESASDLASEILPG